MATRKKKYREFEEKLEELDYNFCSDTVFGLINKLRDLEEKYPKHSGLRVDVDWDYDSMTMNLLGTRTETDKERDKRLTKAMTAREKKAAQEAAILEVEKTEFFRLHDKFGHLL